MENQPQVEVQQPDAEALAQQQEAMVIGLDLQLRVKALEFTKELLCGNTSAVQGLPLTPESVVAMAGAAFNFLKHGAPAPVDKPQDPA